MIEGESLQLVGTERLAARPNDSVLLIQGKAQLEAARDLAGKVYVVIALPKDTMTYHGTDFSQLKGRKVLLWANASEVDIILAKEAVDILVEQVAELKLLAPSFDRIKWKDTVVLGPRAAHLAGMKWKDLLEWARSRVMLCSPVAEPVPRKKPPKKKQKVKAEPYRPPVEEEEAAEALALIADGAEEGAQSNISIWEALGVGLSRAGLPICNVDNALRVLERSKHFRDFVWYDEFHHKYFTTWNSKKPREWEDIDDLNLTMYMQRQLGMVRMSDEMVAKSIKIYARQRVRNEPKDWLSGLKWDGTERVPYFFTVCLGVGDNTYSRAASQNFWIGMVARILNPGCQLDNMIVLEGPQGIGKTRALRAIGGPWYVEANESVQNKDFYMILRGKLLVEIAELDAFSRAEVTRIKQVITCATDSYRAPYDRRVKDHPRMCVFAGTTNEDSYLRDNTGARRFWPVHCQGIKVDMIKKLRSQLFAEAVVLYGKGEKWYEMPDIQTAIEQEKRRQSDEWETICHEYLTREVKDRITVKDIWVNAFSGELARLTKSDEIRIAKALRAIGWTRKDKRINGLKMKYWVSKESDAPSLFGSTPDPV